MSDSEPLCQFITLDATLCLILVGTLLPGFISHLLSQAPQKSVLYALHQSIILISCIIIFHFIAGHSLAMGRDTSLHGVLSDFTESIFLIQWDACDINASAGRAILLNTFIEAVRAAFSALIVFGSVMGRIKFVHLFLIILSWYFIQYIPLVLWMRNPLGWMHDIMHLRDYAGAWNVHAVAGVMGLILLVAFPDVIHVPQDEDSQQPDNLQRDHLRSPMSLDAYPMDQNYPSYNAIEGAPQKQYDAARVVSSTKRSSRAHRYRIKPNNVSRLLFGAWSTFVGLIALAASSHNGLSPQERVSPYRSIMLSTVNTTLSGLITALMFYFLFYTMKKRPSLLIFCRGLVAGSVACAAFAGDVIPLYAVPIACLISCVSFVSFFIMDKIPRLHDATHVVALHVVPGCLSMLVMGFMKEVPSMTDVESGSFLDGFLQLAGLVIGLLWCILTGVCIVLIFKFCIKSAVPAQYAARGVDLMFTFEKKETNPVEEPESGTESEYETYTETCYVRGELDEESDVE